MATFSRNDFYVDTLLTSFVIGYKNPLYIADLLFGDTIQARADISVPFPGPFLADNPASGVVAQSPV